MSFTIQHLTTRNNPNESTVLSRTIFFLILGVAFYLLDRWSLFYLDDYRYAFIMDTCTPIESIKDIWESQVIHYQTINGRFLVHFVVQLFCGILGIEIFRIFNTAFFVLLCALGTRLVSCTWKAPIIWYAITSLAFFLLLPQVGITILGNISHSINYLWSAVASLFFLVIFHNIVDKNKKYNSILLFVYGLVCGALQESFSIPIAGALFLYYCFNTKQIKKDIAYLVVGYFVGACFLIFAPANFVRLSEANAISEKSPIVGLITRIGLILSEVPFLLIFIIGMLYVQYKTSCLKSKAYKPNIIYKITPWLIFVSLLFGVCIIFMAPYQFFIVYLLLIVFWLHRIYRGAIGKRIEQYSLILLSVIVLTFSPLYGFIHQLRETAYDLRNKRIENLESGKEFVYAEYTYNYYKKHRWLKQRYAEIPVFEYFDKQVGCYHFSNDNWQFIPLTEVEMAELKVNGILHSTKQCICAIKTTEDVSEIEETVESYNPLRVIQNRIRTDEWSFFQSRINPQQHLTCFTKANINGEWYYFFWYDPSRNVVKVRINDQTFIIN